MSELYDSSPGVRWEIIMPSEPTVDQLAALHGLAGAFEWVVAQRSMPVEALGETYLDTESQALLDKDLTVLAATAEEKGAKRALNIMAKSGVPTVRSMLAVGKDALSYIWNVSEDSMSEAVRFVESTFPGLEVPVDQGDVDVLVRYCPSLDHVSWVALRACAIDLLRNTAHEWQPSISDLLTKSREVLNLARFHSAMDDERCGHSYPYLKAEAAAFAAKFAIAQQKLVSDAR